MDHLLLGLLLLLQLFAHAHQRVCQLADLILAIELQRRFLARLNLLDVIADLVERMDERDHPQHQDQEDEAERHHRDVEDAVDHHVLGSLGILLIHIRHEDIARAVVHQPHAVTILLPVDLHMPMAGTGQSILIDRDALRDHLLYQRAVFAELFPHQRRIRLAAQIVQLRFLTGNDLFHIDDEMHLRIGERPAQLALREVAAVLPAVQADDHILRSIQRRVHLFPDDIFHASGQIDKEECRKKRDQKKDDRCQLL